MVRQSAQTPGHALVKRAEDKILKHDEAYRQTGIVFEKGGGDKINQCGPDGLVCFVCLICLICLISLLFWVVGLVGDYSKIRLNSAQIC